jgi:VanZ family protein
MLFKQINVKKIYQPSIKFQTIPFVLLILFFVLMVGIGSIPGKASSLSAHFGDKPLHFFAYAFMAFLGFQSINSRRLIRILFSLSLIASLGLIDESIQALLPYREASLADWVFDIAAAIVVNFILNLQTREN